MKIILFLVLPFFAISQELSYEEFMASVLVNHPLSKQANLELNYAEVANLKALGTLDPKLYASHQGKEFKNKEYYTITNSEFKIPTRYGVQFKAKYDRVTGEYYNPQDKTDQNGLWSAGIEIDLLQGLLVNERTTAFKTAENYKNLTQVQRKLLLNQLLYKAAKAYLNWSTNYESLLVINQNIRLAETYLSNTSEMVKLGDKPSIDQLEAKLNVTNQTAIKQELVANYIQSKWAANQFIWQNNELIELLESTTPQTKLRTANAEMAIQTINSNLFLQEKKIKLDQILIDKKLAKENLKPRLKLGYYPLFATKNTILPTGNIQFNQLKYGASFGMPLFRRKEKSQLEKLTIKENQTELEIKNKEAELYTKQQALQAKLNAYKQQYKITTELLLQTKELLNGESSKFDYGESSVFLLTKRQEKVIQTELKLIKIQKKINTTNLDYQYLLNQFHKE